MNGQATITGPTRRVTRALAVLLLATLVCTSAQARPLQVRDGEYTGQVTTGASGAFENTVSFTVFSGGTGLRGSIRFLVSSSVEFEGKTTLLCLRFDADFSTAPIAVTGDGASGSVAVEQASADGACSPASVFEGSQVDTADITVVFNGPVATGSLTFPGDAPLVLEFRAERGGSETTTTTTGPNVAGIGELIDGVALTEETAARLQELEACTELDQLPGERCDPALLALAASPFRDLAEAHFGEGGLDNDSELRRAAFVASVRDPNGKLLCPSLGPMFPVLLAMRTRSFLDPDAGVALNRLVGLLIAMDLDARS